MDRFQVSPVSRPAIILSRVMSLSLNTVIQALILFGLGTLFGARYASGASGVPVLIVSAILLGIPFGSLSIALALTVRKEESVIGAVNFVLLPLTFLSPVFMANGLMPAWIQAVSRFNPVNWSVEAGRAALQLHPDWTVIGERLGWLALFQSPAPGSPRALFEAIGVRREKYLNRSANLCRCRSPAGTQ